MAKKDPSKIDADMQARASHIDTHRFSIHTVMPSYETGAGVIIIQSRKTGALHSLSYKPAQKKNPYSQQQIQTAHEAVEALKTLEAKLSKLKEEKVSPHGLTPGDIVVETSGCTVSRAAFYQITHVPGPRKVGLRRLNIEYAHGCHQNGQVLPVKLDEITPVDATKTLTLSRQPNDYFRYQGMGYSSMKKWDGRPVHVHGD